MKSLKKIIILISIFIIEHSNYCSIAQQQPQATNNPQKYRYNKNLDHADTQAAHRLTLESFISPHMQWAVLSYLGKKDMSINTITGAVQEIPSIDLILNRINNRLDNQYTKPVKYAEKESMKQALQAMLEATDLANFVASLEAAYRNQIYTFYQDVNAQLLAELKDQKTKIQNAINMVNALKPDDQTSSYFSWFTGATATPQQSHVSPLHFDTSAEIVTIPANLIEAIIQKNDYKKETDPMQAANLLFKQCFMAQQHHLKDALWIDQISLNLKNPITPEHYIFTNFPDIDQMCQIAQQLVAHQPIRTNLQASLSQEHVAAHQLLLHIRQALQTAMYIANAKSSYNVNYILPSAIRTLLGGTINQLLDYDARLSTLCKNPMYGATPEDTFRDEQRSTITKIAAGAAITAALAGDYFLTGGSLTGIGTVVKAVAPVVNKAGELASQYVPKAWQPPTEGTETALAIALRYGTIGAGISGTAQTLGSAGVATTQILRTADEKGFIPLDPATRSYVDQAHYVASGANIFGKAGDAIAGIGNAALRTRESWKNAGNSPGIINVASAINETAAINNAIKNANYNTQAALNFASTVMGVGSQLTGATHNQNQSQQHQQASPDKFTPQAVAHAFGQIIQDAPAKGWNAGEQITNVSIQLLENNKISPNELLGTLKYIQESKTHNNPELGEQLHNLIQNLTQFIENAPQAIQQ